MYYIISLTSSSFSRQLDENGACKLAFVSGLFAAFKYRHNFPFLGQTPLVFHIVPPFPWQSVDLFLSLFSGPCRQLLWEVDDLVEFVKISSFLMVAEWFLSYCFPPILSLEFCQSFRANQFCKVLFALKTYGYLCLAYDLMQSASNMYENIFIFDDLLVARTAAHFLYLVEQRFNQLSDD